MTGNRADDTIAAIERRILCALCNSSSASADWDALMNELSEHAWREPEHRVVYEALRQIRSRNTETRCEELPAQATRMGFPDVEWAIYLAAGRDEEVDFEKLIAQLRAAASDGP
jgi:hypothetical protein